MKVIILVLALVAVALAAPPLAHYESRQSSEYNVQQGQQGQYNKKNVDASRDAKILRYESELGFGDEGYKYSIETSDGISKEEQAVFEDVGAKDKSLKVTGRYLYPGGPNGELIFLSYIADQFGFHPIGDHLPKNVEPIH